jgi:hypothetical protein
VTPPLDDSIKALQVFCEELRETNPVLESGASSLDKMAHALSDAESRLSLDLGNLATDVDGLQKEAETTEAAAVKVCAELAHAAEEAKTPTLSDLETHAGEAKDHWTHALQEKSPALATAFQEMKGSGWDPLEAVLAHEKTDFETWTQAADVALQGLVHVLASVASDLEQDGTDAKTAAQALTDAPPATEAFWQPLSAQGFRVANEVAHHFGEDRAQQSADLEKVHDELVNAAGDGSGHVHDQLGLTVQKAADAIHAQSGHVTDALEKAVEALGRAQAEFEHAAVQADHVQGTAHDLAELAGPVVTAKAQLQERK